MIVKMSTLQKVEKENHYADLVPIISDSCLKCLFGIFCPGHVKPTESLAGDDIIHNNLTHPLLVDKRVQHGFTVRLWVVAARTSS